MSVKQISVFLENKPGTLLEMTGVLAEKQVDMRALSLAETSDFGIARLIVDDVYAASTVLKENGFIHNIASVLCVCIPDEPGGLNEVLQLLSAAGVNVEYMYAFLGRREGKALMVLKADDEVKVQEVLTSNGIALAAPEEI